MVKKEGPQRFGRFIKKSDRLLSTINIAEFSFEEICDAAIAYPDNVSGSILHTRLHDPKELKASVKTPLSFNTELVDPGKARPILQPLDFTADWLSEKQRNKRRIRRSDEDDDDLDPLAPHETEDDQSAPNANASAEAEDVQVRVEETPDQKHLDLFQQGLTKEGIGRAIKELSRLPVNGPTSANDASEFIPMGGTAAAGASAAAGGRAEENGAEPPQDEVPQAPEEAALAEYRQSLARKAIDAAQLEKLESEARAKGQAEGYEEGFRIGEEKAELQVRQSAGQMFAKLEELVREFEGLKKTILESARENFTELCQALAESLLGHEFSMHPEAFATVIQRAIQEGVSDDVVRIVVHPETYDALLTLKTPELKDLAGILAKDESMTPWDFRIDARSGAVDTRIRDLVGGLIEQASGVFDKKEAS